MPQLLEHIDAIARKVERDVLYLQFHEDLNEELDWRRLPVRTQIIEWLDAQGIDWRPCGHVGSTTFMCSYRGQIYLDVPFDENDPVYPILRDYLEKPDGTIVFAGTRFCYYPLVEAMKNAHHDVAGFWEDCAKNY